MTLEERVAAMTTEAALTLLASEIRELGEGFEAFIKVTTLTMADLTQRLSDHIIVTLKEE